MPYVWAIGLIWCGMSDAVLAAVAWCALFVFGTWLIEASKPIVQLLRDREALVWTIEVAMLTAASSNDQLNATGASRVAVEAPAGRKE